ncbi:secretory calcium-binding phosphoprotein 5 [Odontesthes bonariensis]|uniref:secretory calcium-binding phosphoprotein 5 n=1 Tax=Odontesthes bonariensis TaxID=219752 RepID=UPI003F581842
MKLAIFCLCLAGTASAVPYQYLPHYTGTRQQVPPTQVKSPLIAGFPQAGLPGAYSMEFIYPFGFAGGAAGPNPEQPISRYGLVKFSIPQPPGRQSLEVFYPYDFTNQRVMQNMPPMTNGPISPDVLPFGYPPQNIPQQPVNIPPFNTNAVPSQDPLQSLQQDQPTQTNQMPTKM